MTLKYLILVESFKDGLPGEPAYRFFTFVKAFLCSLIKAMLACKLKHWIFEEFLRQIKIMNFTRSGIKPAELFPKNKYSLLKCYYILFFLISVANKTSMQNKMVLD